MDDGFSLNMDVFYPASLSILWGPGNSFKTMCNSCMHISMNNFFIKFLKQRQREKKRSEYIPPLVIPQLPQSVSTYLPTSLSHSVPIVETNNQIAFFSSFAIFPPLYSFFFCLTLPILAFPPPPPSPPPVFSSLSFPLTSHFFLS